MDSRFLSSEEQPYIFLSKPVHITSLQENFSFWLLSASPQISLFAEPPGTWLNAGMTAAGNGTCMNWHREKAGGILGRNLRPATQSNVF